LVARGVDALPHRLWRPANLYVGARLHFCRATGPSGGTFVRNVEWNGREVARGVKPFSYDEWNERWPEEDLEDDL
jgi:hypothetical protein